MKKTLHLFLFCILFNLVLHGQINTMNINLSEEVEDTTISAINHPLSFTAAHLSKPTTFSHENYSKDLVLLSSLCILFFLNQIINYRLNSSLIRMQLKGFLFAVKYKSNYLPRSINSF